MKFRPCPCGSGLDSRLQCDAQGQNLMRTCLKCHLTKMAIWQIDVTTNPAYLAEKPAREEN